MADTHSEGGHSPASSKRTADVLSPTTATPPSKQCKGDVVEGVLAAFHDDRIKEVFKTLMSEAFSDELKKRDEKIAALTKSKFKLQAEVNELRTRLDDIVERHDDLEQYGRRQSLRLHTNIEEEKDEDTDALVLAATTEMGVDVQLCDISRSHRVGKKNPSKPRPIIFKLISYRKRRAIYQNRKRLGDDQYITEDLTARRSHLLYRCRLLRRSGVLQYVWTADGRILVKEAHEYAQTIEVKRESDLSRFGTIAPERMQSPANRSRIEH